MTVSKIVSTHYTATFTKGEFFALVEYNITVILWLNVPNKLVTECVTETRVTSAEVTG